MHTSTAEFRKLLASYGDEHDKRAVALEFAELFIEQENVEEIISALEEVAADVIESFMARINQAPKTDPEWDQVSCVGAGLSSEAADKMKARWRQCVGHVRRAQSLGIIRQ